MLGLDQYGAPSQLIRGDNRRRPDYNRKQQFRKLMSWHSLGPITVTVPGVRVRMTANQVRPDARIGAEAILFQAISNQAHVNTGRVYIYDSQTSAAPLATLAVPTANSIPSASATTPGAPGGLNPADYYIDADNPGDGVNPSYLTP